MPISENLLSTLGSYSTWAGNAIAAHADGITSSSSNSWGISSLTFENTENVYFEWEGKWGGGTKSLQFGWCDGSAYGGTDLIFIGFYESTMYLYAVKDAGGLQTLDSVAHGIETGSIHTFGLRKSGTTYTGYIDDIEMVSGTVDLTDLDTMTPFLMSNAVGSHIRSIDEVVAAAAVGPFPTHFRVV